MWNASDKKNEGERGRELSTRVVIRRLYARTRAGEIVRRRAEENKKENRYPKKLHAPLMLPPILPDHQDFRLKRFCQRLRSPRNGNVG